MILYFSIFVFYLVCYLFDYILLCISKYKYQKNLNRHVSIDDTTFLRIFLLNYTILLYMCGYVALFLVFFDGYNVLYILYICNHEKYSLYIQKYFFFFNIGLHFNDIFKGYILILEIYKKK